ncbi:MAG TPA: hypothetical protein VG298_01200 [Acidimicrobiales bacterium]|nr:hypothetical protein [Acidimicrobiales bacterium]
MAIAAVLLGVLTAGCGGTRSGAHTLTGPGGIPYQWPPPPSVATGPATTARFCALVIDDYEHLKALQGGTHPEPLPAATTEYMQMLPGLQGAAPPAIAPAATTYLSGLQRLLSLLAAHSYNYFAIPSPQLKAASDSKVADASAAVESYVNGQCHYDLSANLPIRPPITS